MQYQAGASPWDRHIAVGNPVAGQWTRDDSPALELWLGPWGPECWGDETEFIGDTQIWVTWYIRIDGGIGRMG